MKLNLIFLTLLFCSCTSNTFSGHVYDYDTNKPIMRAQVEANGNSTETDSSGYFTIKVRPNSECKILFRKEGYAAKNINRKPDSLGIFSKQNLKRNKIYLFNIESDFSNKN